MRIASLANIGAASETIMATVTRTVSRVSQEGNLERVVTADRGVFDKVATRLEHVEKVVDDAANATESEHQMGIMEAFRAYPKAVMFSMIFSTAIVMYVSWRWPIYWLTSQPGRVSI